MTRLENMFIFIVFLLALGIGATIAHAELYVMQKNNKLYVIDEAGTSCFSWNMKAPLLNPSAPSVWTKKSIVAEQFNWKKGTQEEVEICKSFKPVIITVAKNKTYSTRPLKKLDSTVIGRVNVGTVCEQERIKRYSSTSIKLGWHYTTNHDGLRGIAVCISN